MKRILSASFLFVFFTLSLFAQDKNVQRWEYFQVDTCDQNLLSKYGDDGWELTGVTRYDSNCERFTFKRPKPANAPKYVEPSKQKILEEKEKPTCQLTLAQAPKFRGIRLGMSVKEMLSLFPGSEQSEDVTRVLQYINKNFGSGGFTFDFDRYGRTKETATLFDGIRQYGFEVFDDRVVSYSVTYSDFRPDLNWNWTVPVWEEKLTEVFHLPALEYWGKNSTNNTRYGGSSMRCQGFTIVSQVSGRSAGLTIKERIEPTVSEQVNQRYEAASDKVRQSFKIVP